LYVIVPAFQALWSREDELSGHHRRYRRRALAAIIEAARFRLEYATYFFFPLVPAIWLARSLPYKLGIAAARSHASSATDHGVNDSPGVKVVNVALRLEGAFLRTGVRVPWGSSLLVVAQAT
jgi:hypothetical protein